MADIFISYASVDRPLVRRLADALETHGWSVWWDHHNLRGGQHFDLIIEEAISTAQAVIVVWSPDSTKSNWVRAEAAQALEQEKLVPLRINGAVLPLRFRNIHTIDLSSWTGETDAEPFERLIKDLGHYLDPPNASGRPEHPDVLTAPHPRAAAPAKEHQQPARTAPIAERSHASPDSGAPLASSIAPLHTSTPRSTSSTGRNRVGKYFAVIAVTGGILWGAVALKDKPPPKDKQPPPTNPPIETTVSRPPDPKPPDPKPPDPSAAAAAAQAAYDRRDYAKALSLARPAAERGDPAAQSILGTMYLIGTGVPVDKDEAVRWLRKAADQGIVDAQNLLASQYARAQNYAETARWYRKAADQGDAGAQYFLARMYEDGQGVPQDIAQARAWMQKAAAGGHQDAKRWLTKN